MEKSLFIEFMGDSPTTRVIDYLLTERNLDFSITDMAENAGISRATLYRIWGSLIKNRKMQQITKQKIEKYLGITEKALESVKTSSGNGELVLDMAQRYFSDAK